MAHTVQAAVSSLKCQDTCLIINRLAGPGRLTDDWRGGTSGGSRGMCSLAHVSDALGVKHFIARFGLTLTSTFHVKTDFT
jgi:hypothetical protein